MDKYTDYANVYVSPWRLVSWSTYRYWMMWTSIIIFVSLMIAAGIAAKKVETPVRETEPPQTTIYKKKTQLWIHLGATGCAVLIHAVVYAIAQWNDGGGVDQFLERLALIVQNYHYLNLFVIKITNKPYGVADLWKFKYLLHTST